MSYNASTATLGNISEVASLYSTSRIDMDSLSLSSNLDPTPTSSSSSFKTISTGLYRISNEDCPQLADFVGSKKHAVLAEAEDLDDDIEDAIDNNLSADDVEYMDNENLADSIEMFDVSKKENKKINQIKHTFDSIDSNKNMLKTCTETPKSTILLPSEKVSDSAREYWATLDLYNNSKMAFNKRTKSVRLKREKLNNELLSSNNMTPPPVQRTASNSNQSTIPNTPQQTHNPDTCKCVKCSIVYHESAIKSVSGSCRKCGMKLVACKCCTSSSGSLSSSGNNNNSSNSTTASEIRRDLFETKLFDIKNELVSLSETSLDVFQLLLQLSDTMLELNSQLTSNSLLSSRQNSNSQLLLINQLISSNLSLNNEYLEATTASTTANLPKPHNNRRIEDFLQKTLNSVQFSSNTISSSRRNNGNNNKLFVESSRSFDEKSNSEEDSDHLIENLYDKTSVTQFVDSFFKNENTNTSKNMNINSSESSFSMHSQNSGCYSLLSTLNKNSHFADSDFIIDENPYQVIDDDLMGKVESLKQEAKEKDQALKNVSKKTSNAESVSLNSDALSISSTHSSLNRSQPTDKSPTQARPQQAATSKGESTPPPTHTSISETNSSNSSSSGRTERTGSSSICSSSNMDLSSLPSTSSSSTNITNSDQGHLTNSSTANSLVLNESQTINRRCLTKNTDDYNNKITDNLIQSYRRNQSPPPLSQTAAACGKKSTIIPELPLSENCLSQNMQHQNSDQHAPLYGSYQRNTNKTSAGSIYGSSVLQAGGSTRRKPSFKFDSNILNRVQTMGLEKSIDEAKTLDTCQTSGSRSFRFGDKPVNHHQVSLDSGIYLPTEIEEHN